MARQCGNRIVGGGQGQQGIGLRDCCTGSALARTVSVMSELTVAARRLNAQSDTSVVARHRIFVKEAPANSGLITAAAGFHDGVSLRSMARPPASAMLADDKRMTSK
ncbi:MAG TPA: hypothetical protein VKP67_16060 [Xanthobacteraceae bacterium]|nr:hypothetical protein [Xanthobacteraceae bacterium]